MARQQKLNLNNEYGQKALDLFKKGYSNNYITQEINDMGLKVHHSTVNAFLNKLKRENEIIETKPSENILLIENEIIETKLDLKKVMNELNLNENLDNESVLNNASKLINKIFILTSLILIIKLQDYSEGKCKYPRELFRCYEISLNSLNMAYGITKNTNILKAINSLEIKEDAKEFTHDLALSIRRDIYGLE